jgi:hypothetical protein
MTNKIRIVEQDIIFLSYDEPNAEKNYADLCQKIPWAKRVHGIKGSDAAHKACAELADTDNFITVDGDNIVSQNFLNVEIDLDEIACTRDHVLSWCGKIHVNGLQYGNGGLKLWNKKFVENMRTHEASKDGDAANSVEFCFNNLYYHLNENYSTSYTNASPLQAFRAGFREGVKMSLNQGAPVKDIKSVWWQNYERLLIWCSVGADVENGLWSIYGAREGCYLTNCTDWDYTQVRDFEYLTDQWNNHYSNFTDVDLQDRTCDLGRKLQQDLGIEIVDLDKNASRFLKRVYHNTPRIVKNRKKLINDK